MSNFTNSTMNRGVEAKEIEIANARLDIEASNSTQWTAAGEEARGAGPASPASPDLTGSYLQVVVEKHKRKKEFRPAATSARLPVASSPGAGGAGAGGAGDGARWPRGTVLVACPVAAPDLSYYMCAGGAGGAGGVGGARGDVGAVQQTQVKKHRSWHIFREPKGFVNADADEDEGEECSAEPECVEVYRFERVGAWLSCGAARPTRVRRRAARGVRWARAAAAELGAAARLAAGAPLHAALLALRCALQLARDAAAGAVHALSDYALKPALALAFNAVLHPVLVFVGNLLRGTLEAVRPACGAVAELAAAGAVLLRAVRLVELNYAPPCACRADASSRHHC